MSFRHKNHALRSLAAIAFSIAAALSHPALTAVQAADLIISQGSEPLGFDPTQFATGNHVYLHQLYDTLVELDVDGNPTPALAESWSRADDGLTVTFKLRQASFHSGRSVTAADVVETIKRYLNPDVGANLGERMESFASTTAIDDSTVQITLNSPTPGLFDLLSAVFIQDPAAIDGLARNDAGSGPYRLTAFEPGVSFVMTKVPDHWRASAEGPENIVVRIIPDEGSAAAALRSGETDIMLQASAQTSQNLEGADGLTIWRADLAPVTYYLMANTTRGPLANKAFRQALQRAIDRETIAAVVYSGVAVPTCQPWSARHWAHDPSLESACAFDLAAAKADLDASGVAGATLTVNTAVDSYSPGSSATAQILQQSLAEIGVTLKIVTYEQAQARQLLLASDFDLLLHQYTEGGNDPQFILPSGLYGPNGRSKFTSDEYEKLVSEANATLDPARRKAIYSDISRLIVDEAFIMPIVHGFRAYPMQSSLSGFALDVSGFPILTSVTSSR